MKRPRASPFVSSAPAFEVLKAFKRWRGKASCGVYACGGVCEDVYVQSRPLGSLSEKGEREGVVGRIDDQASKQGTGI